ncbi:MAG: cyclic pyranopterin monophosphate synthase MoaC [Candidatus Krumholzibacteria bacterium]|nr:cyclic pyranopterin monophosphate synthase MoaC [Candidatus Krumholzibacteria bacterium]
MKKFSHIGQTGEVKMVDISGKEIEKRTAVAAGAILMSKETVAMIGEGLLKKGDPLATARIAGIMAAKKTSDLIPLCHPLPIAKVGIDFNVGVDRIDIEATVVTTARTGIEMEALTAVAVAGLAIYDMCKAVDKSMTVCEIRLVSKKKEKK